MNEKKLERNIRRISILHHTNLFIITGNKQKSNLERAKILHLHFYIRTFEHKTKREFCVTLIYSRWFLYGENSWMIKHKNSIFIRTIIIIIRVRIKIVTRITLEFRPITIEYSSHDTIRHKDTDVGCITSGIKSNKQLGRTMRSTKRFLT